MTRWRRFVEFLRRLRIAFTPSEIAWRGASAALWCAVGLVALAVLVTDVLPFFSVGKLAGFAIAIAALLLAGLLFRLALWLIALLPRRYRGSLFLLLPLLLLLLLPGAGPKGIGIVAAALVFVSATLGGGLAVLARDGLRPREQKVTLAALVSGLALLIAGLAMLIAPRDPANPALAGFRLEDRTLDLPDPGRSGDHAVRTLTYGTGLDLRRPEYGENVDVVSRSVDGSKLIDNWEGPGGWLRTRYWGFDATGLPLQGRVWHPDGDGPFPLVLIVHGNHGMEDFSDPGYAYLGEMLASRGYVFVSVDENFLNSSFADLADMLGPGLEEENDARGWLLLEHLALWSEWTDDPAHPLSGLVDMGRVALIGHSRGGEAVAVAAAFNRLDRYPDDATLEFDYGFGIRGVIAIAPSDGQYEPRDRPTPLRDVDYFVIHGSLDGDVTSFMGSSQYSRVELAPGSSAGGFRFKSSLYVLGANHGQFNTSWGRNDIGGLWGWALDTRPIMDPEQQRRVARTYFGAFLDVTLRGERGYLPIFRDARRAASWLPDTFYVQSYSDSRDAVIANFEEDLDPATTTLAGGTIEAENLTKWREQWVPLKWGTLHTHAALFAWDDEALDNTASLSVRLPERSHATGPETELVFALSAFDETTRPEGWEEGEEGPDGEAAADADRGQAPRGSSEEGEGVESSGDESHQENEREDDDAEPLDWTIVVTDAAGESASLPLSHDRPLFPQVQAPTRRASFLEFAGTSEVVFHRHSIELGDFAAKNPAFDPTAVREIGFVFDLSPAGVVFVDDIAFSVGEHAGEPAPEVATSGESR
jgi:dienelactone hydrolase